MTASILMRYSKQGFVPYYRQAWTHMTETASIIYHIARGWVMAPIFLTKRNCHQLANSFRLIWQNHVLNHKGHGFDHNSFIIVQVQNSYCWKTAILQQYACWLTKLFASKKVKPLTEIDLKTAELSLWISNSKEHIDAPHIPKPNTIHNMNKVTLNLHSGGGFKQQTYF